MASLSLTAETSRISELYGFAILDTPREREFDRLVQRAAGALRVPTALISLVDRERQWFKAGVGMSIKETPRDHSFCAHLIEEGSPLIVEDALLDPRFRDSPLVTNDPKIRFYAGAPLLTSSGKILGALCVIDYKPRGITSAELATLTRIASAVTGQIEMRSTVRDINAEFARRDVFSVPSSVRPVSEMMSEQFAH